MKSYYISYEEKAEVNYTFIFCLFKIADCDKKEKIDNTIIFKSQKELAEQIKESCGISFSAPTVSRIIKDTENYLPYFSVIAEQNKIILNNNFKKGKNSSNKFVVLNEKEILFLLQQNNKLLNKYYLYLKYYIGYSKSKKIDTTANQILSAIGYSCNCGNNKNALCKFNSLLLEKGFIKIQKVKDTKGYCRNIYTMSL